MSELLSYSKPTENSDVPAKNAPQTGGHPASN